MTVGGLARSDSGNFTDEFAALLDRLRGAATARTDRGARPSRSIGAGKD